MLHRTALCFLFLTISSVATANAQQADQLKNVKRGKKATALVINLTDPGTGSAFCIDAKRGLFISNHHVTGNLGSNIALVLEPDEPDQRVVRARVLRVDPDADLALMKADLENKNAPATLELGTDEDLVETQQTTAFGYPFGGALALSAEKFPSVSTNVGRISALRKNNGKLETIQVDTELNPGNSGGPVIDASGKVIGVTVAGIPGSGVNMLIPVNKVHAFLKKPQIVINVPEVKFDDRYEPLDVSVDIVSFTGEGGRFTVDMVVSSGEDDQRRFNGRPGRGGTYILRTALLPKDEGPGPGLFRLPAEVTLTDADMTCDIIGKSVQIDNKTFKLSDVARIDRVGNQYAVEPREGKTIFGKRLSMPGLKLEFAGTRIDLDVKKLKRLSIFEAEEEPAIVNFTITARQKGAKVAEEKGTFQFTGEPQRLVITASGQRIAKAEKPEPNRSKPQRPRPDRGPSTARGAYIPPEGEPTFEDPVALVKLGGKYERYAVGAGGRYMLFHIKEKKTIEIVDVLSAKVVHEITDIAEDAIIAAGRERFVIVLPGQKLMQRWNYETFKREKVGRVSVNGAVWFAHIGTNNASGPMLLAGENAQFISLQSLKPIPIEGDIIGGKGRYGYRLDGSADGRTFAGIVTGLGPVSYTQMILDDRSTFTKNFSSTSNANRWAKPSADGTLFFMPGAQIYTNALRKIEAAGFEHATLYPTVDPRYFLAVRFVEDKAKKKHVTHAMVCTMADRRIVHTYIGMEEMAPKGYHNVQSSIRRDLHFGGPRFEYMPWANLLISMPREQTEVYIRKFHLLEALNETGIDYLYVDSIPPVQATKGRTLSYQINAVSKAGGVTYNLEDSPAGLKVSKEGMVRWNVSSRYPDETAGVIVSVKDAAGEEILHSFEMVVTEFKPR